jgi:hypothetical protein
MERLEKDYPSMAGQMSWVSWAPKIGQAIPEAEDPGFQSCWGVELASTAEEDDGGVD